MAITLAMLTGLATWVQGVVLGPVGLGMTVSVYGTVALIVKADDFGAVLARTGNGAVRAVGRGPNCRITLRVSQLPRSRSRRDSR